MPAESPHNAGCLQKLAQGQDGQLALDRGDLDPGFQLQPASDEAEEAVAGCCAPSRDVLGQRGVGAQQADLATWSKRTDDLGQTNHRKRASEAPHINVGVGVRHWSPSPKGVKLRGVRPVC